MKKLAKLLIDKKLTISTAESCTSGALANKLTSISGSSLYFECGFITYSNNSKQQLLSVSKNTLEKYGAVSEECIREMVLGLITTTKTNIGIAISGVAGPNGGSKEKPVGTVFFGFYINDNIYIKKEHFLGNRSEVVAKSVDYAIKTIYKYLSS
ncbi:Molybdopterin binding motif, CinA N-terminal domain / C-terminal domain of CinA type S [hydrothermal vent metagenome]|uniref:Molybdopterin binding motif, CinA N-terminal domain / C-terminal domain of CinA type S n=1 Tax=hydrothermal vent metagenome TaxID=652676 RepID=A0A1W1CA56_9ZZZZ